MASMTMLCYLHRHVGHLLEIDPIQQIEPSPEIVATSERQHASPDGGEVRKMTKRPTPFFLM